MFCKYLEEITESAKLVDNKPISFLPESNSTSENTQKSMADVEPSSLLKKSYNHFVYIISFFPKENEQEEFLINDIELLSGIEEAQYILLEGFSFYFIFLLIFYFLFFIIIILLYFNFFNLNLV